MENNDLEGIAKECILKKKFKVMEDSRSLKDNGRSYVGKTIVVDDKYNYGYEENKYVGDVVWAHLAGQPDRFPYTRKICFYLKELKPIQKIKFVPMPEYSDD